MPSYHNGKIYRDNNIETIREKDRARREKIV